MSMFVASAVYHPCRMVAASTASLSCNLGTSAVQSSQLVIDEHPQVARQHNNAQPPPDSVTEQKVSKRIGIL